jgi:hypothetical protein
MRTPGDQGVPEPVFVHLPAFPAHASRRNQEKGDFSIIQRKVLMPNDFADLGEIETRLIPSQVPPSTHGAWSRASTHTSGCAGPSTTPSQGSGLGHGHPPKGVQSSQRST